MKTKSLVLSLSLVLLSNLPAEDLILNGQTVTMFGDHTYGIVSLINSTINVEVYTGYDDGRGFLRIYADSIIIDANSRINADGKSGHFDNSYPEDGSGSSHGYGSAGYGGLGGDGGNPENYYGGGGSIYGSFQGANSVYATFLSRTLANI